MTGSSLQEQWRGIHQTVVSSSRSVHPTRYLAINPYVSCTLANFESCCLLTLDIKLLQSKGEPRGIVQLNRAFGTHLKAVSMKFCSSWFSEKWQFLMASVIRRLSIPR